MSLLDFIGFFVGFLALFVLFFRKKQEMRQQVHNPMEEEKHIYDRDKALRRFILGVDEEDEEEEERAMRHTPPPPTPKRKEPPISFTSKPQKIIPSTTRFEVERRTNLSRAAQLLSQLSSKQQMVILHEIFDKPLAIRGEQRDDIP